MLQRARTLERFVADVCGERDIVFPARELVSAISREAATTSASSIMA